MHVCMHACMHVPACMHVCRCLLLPGASLRVAPMNGFRAANYSSSVDGIIINDFLANDSQYSPPIRSTYISLEHFSPSIVMSLSDLM